MATTINSILLEGSGFRGAINGAFTRYPELINTLYTSHYRYVLKVCRHFFWRSEDAEDAASEVFLKLHRVLDTEESSMKSRPWLSKVAGRNCIDRLRKVRAERRRRVDQEDFDALPGSSALSPLSNILLREKQSQVREKLRRLPRDYRILLVLHYYRHMSYAEIADRLGRQLPAVKTAIFRAKRALRKSLES